MKYFSLYWKNFFATDHEKLQYPQHLQNYFCSCDIVNFIKINPELENHTETDASVKMTLKLDIEKTKQVSEVTDLKRAVANILGLETCAVRLLGIKRGCVEVTFLIPFKAADVIFTTDRMFTADEFQSLSVLRLKCGNVEFNFGIPQDADSKGKKSDLQINISGTYMP